MFKAMFLAGCGGFIGTCCRYLTGRWCSIIFHGAFPLGTFIVNILGCFVIGLLFGILEKTDFMSSARSALLITGFCGGFTTFSTFADDLYVLGSKENWSAGLLYLVSSILCGVALVWAGRALVR